MRDGLFVALERVARRYEALEARLAHELQGELEGRPWPFGSVLTPISVGAAQLDLALPQWSEVQPHDARHSDEHDPAAGAHDLEALLQGARAPHAVHDEVDPTGEPLDDPIVRFESERAREPSGCSLVLAWLDDLVGAEVARELALIGMLGHRDEGTREAKCPQGRDHAEPEGPGAQHDDPLPAGDVGGKGRVDRAGGGFDHDGRFV